MLRDFFEMLENQVFHFHLPVLYPESREKVLVFINFPLMRITKTKRENKMNFFLSFHQSG